MSVEIKGIPELQRSLEKRFGKEVMERKSDKALDKVSDYVLNELKKEFEKFKDTGATIAEMTKTPSQKLTDGNKVIRIIWEGPKSRQSIIHLLEHGFERDGKKYTPPSFGLIAKTLSSCEPRYKAIMRNEMLK